MEEKAKNFRFFLIFTEKSRKKRSKKRQNTESRALPFSSFQMTFTQNPLPQRQSIIVIIRAVVAVSGQIIKAEDYTSEFV